MKTRLSQVIGAIIPGLFALSVIFAATAQAEGGKPAHSVNVTAMGQSLNAQLRGYGFQFAIESNGRLDLTGEGRGVATPQEAVELVRSDRFGGSATTCHLHLGRGIEAALVVTEPASALPQPCAVLGAAIEAA